MNSITKGVEVIWKDTKRFCGLPITFTQYALLRKPGKWIKLIRERGLFHTEIEEIHCYRIDDLSVYQSFTDSIFGVGNIEVFCNDASTKSLYIQKVKKPYKVREIINDIVEEERAKKVRVHAELQ